MQREVYVAFSIHGTNTFITANTMIDLPAKPAYGSIVKVPFSKPGDNSPLFTLDFRADRSRDGSSLRDSSKLLSSYLTEADGSPTKNAMRVLHFFNLLSFFGWSVEASNFINRHKLDTTALANERSIALAEKNIDSFSIEQFDLLVKNIAPGSAATLPPTTGKIAKPKKEKKSSTKKAKAAEVPATSDPAPVVEQPVAPVSEETQVPQVTENPSPEAPVTSDVDPQEGSV